jgi:hypothetical protein
MRTHHQLAAVFLITAVSTPVFAWGPCGLMPSFSPGYADGSGPWAGPWGRPYPFAGPGYAYAPPPAPFGFPEAMDPMPEFAPPRYDSGPGSDSGSGLGSGQTTSIPARPAIYRSGRSHLSISRRAMQDAYVVEIRLANIDPEQVQILPEGRGLRVAYQTQSQDYRNDVFDGGYRRGYSTMSGSASQRFGLPPDADLAAMSREVTPDRILLSIPRKDPGRSGPWSNPPRPEAPPETR